MTTINERLDEMWARADAATEGVELERYDWGGGRLAVFDAQRRELVADFYGEADREFYTAARTDLPRAVDALRAVMAMLDKTDKLAHEGNDPISASDDYWQGARNAHDYLSGAIRATIADALGVQP